MNAAHDRRAILGAVVAGAACISVPWNSEACASLADPVYEAIARHRQAYDAFMEVWEQTHVLALYDRAKTDEGAAAELREFRELENQEEAAFHALLATRPTTKAGAIACVKHVAECGLAEMRAWLALLAESPLLA